MINEMQARRLAGLLTDRQRQDIMTLAMTIQKISQYPCERFDPITAGCAPCCSVCSHFRSDCLGERKAAPVLGHRNGREKQTRTSSVLHRNFTKIQEACQEA